MLSGGHLTKENNPGHRALTRADLLIHGSEWTETQHVVQRQLIESSSQGDCPVDIRLPALKDGAIPRKRAQLCEESAATVAARWRLGENSSEGTDESP